MIDFLDGKKSSRVCHRSFADFSPRLSDQARKIGTTDFAAWGFAHRGQSYAAGGLSPQVHTNVDARRCARTSASVAHDATSLVRAGAAAAEHVQISRTDGSDGNDASD